MWFKRCAGILCSHHELCLISCLLLGCQGSDGELRGEKDGMSDSESKVDSGVPDVPVPPDDTPEVLNKALSGLSSRYCYPDMIMTELCVLKLPAPLLYKCLCFIDRWADGLFQMEELVGTRNPHASNDLLLLLHCLPGPNSAHGNCKYNLFYLKTIVRAALEVLCICYMSLSLLPTKLFCWSPLGKFKAWSSNFFPEAASFIWYRLLCFLKNHLVCHEKSRNMFTRAVFVQVLCVQIKCFQEIITIGYSIYHSYDLPWFRTLSWWGRTHSHVCIIAFDTVDNHHLSLFSFVADLLRFVFWSVSR